MKMQKCYVLPVHLPATIPASEMLLSLVFHLRKLKVEAFISIDNSDWQAGLESYLSNPHKT